MPEKYFDLIKERDSLVAFISVLNDVSSKLCSVNSRFLPDGSYDDVMRLESLINCVRDNALIYKCNTLSLLKSFKSFKKVCSK